MLATAGPLFVRANQESLSHGTNLDDYFTLMKRVVGECPMQVLMMGYCNTAFMIGFDQFPVMLKEMELPDLSSLTFRLRSTGCYIKKVQIAGSIP